MRVSFHIGGRPQRHRHHHRHYHHRRHHHHIHHGPATPVGSGGRIVFGIITIIIAFVVLFIGYRNQTRTEDFITTQGVVVDYHEKYDYDSGYLYSEIVVYEVDGVKYEHSSGSYSNIPRVIGSYMEVKYNPLNPKDAVVGSVSQNIFIYVIGGVFGLVGVILIFTGAKSGFISGNRSEEE